MSHCSWRHNGAVIQKDQKPLLYSLSHGYYTITKCGRYVKRKQVFLKKKGVARHFLSACNFQGNVFYLHLSDQEVLIFSISVLVVLP